MITAPFLIRKFAMEKQESAQKRIEYLLNNRVDEKSKSHFATTKKGISVLVAVKYFPFEIELFDIETAHEFTGRSLVLWASQRDDALFIQDIQGGKSFGHGELAMSYLIDYAKVNSYKFITGELALCDIETHKERLYAFYTKFGFEIDFGDGTNFGMIKKTL